MNLLTQFKNTTILPVLIALMLGCFGLLPQAQATCQDACLTNDNTVQGDDALISNTTGTDNTAIGFNALNFNTTGFSNTAIGWQALSSNTTGGGNTATGVQALELNTTGNDNTATGATALEGNTTGNDNTATGVNALYFNQTGNSNTADGFKALYGQEFASVTGSDNTAIGYQALGGYTSGSSNTAIGYQALLRNTKGDDNIAVGREAGRNLTSGDRNIDIGNLGVAGEAKTIRIGTGGRQINTYIAGINGVTVAGGVGVIIDSTGHLGTVSSSAQYKHQIKPMDKASEAILSLKPVTFQYKHELDPDGIPQFGLVAEDVEKVSPDLVARDEQGKPYTVRYEAVNAMLLNEFLKEHRKNEKQEATIAHLTSALAKQQATVAQQRKDFEAAIAQVKAQVQKVSAQLELNKSAPQVVKNP